ncbi:hypothetical protein DYI37_11560 [Fulvimarina endophytica]|uniref:Ner winged helix-turn-helix DNA-binding domain-containing protein n=1 Tax=Fulvimarina endophytica TaxID=2293836 RepID=A0A371X3P1_9HYPH|nr:hypothetical protein DYI37_11560 [Fulvimarina endophytica]
MSRSAVIDPRIEQAESIRGRLRIAGWSCRRIDLEYDLNRGSASLAILRAHEPGERAIADVLGVEPSSLWPARYDEEGMRLSPQPAANYDRPPTHAQRRKALEARS